eukprot:Opistho-2@25141
MDSTCDMFPLEFSAEAFFASDNGFDINDLIVPDDFEDLLFDGANGISSDDSSLTCAGSPSSCSGSNTVPGSPLSSCDASTVAGLPLEWDGECTVPKEGEMRTCTNCSATKTPLWRKGADGGFLCNACGLYFKAYQSHRPTCRAASKKPRAKSAMALAAAEGCAGAVERCAPNGQSCANCATTRTTLWRRDTKGRLVCNACGLYSKMHKKDRPLKLKGTQIRTRSRKFGGDVLSSKPAKPVLSASASAGCAPALSVASAAHCALPPFFGLSLEHAPPVNLALAAAMTNPGESAAACASVAASVANMQFAAAALSMGSPFGYPLMQMAPMGSPFAPMAMASAAAATPEDSLAFQLRLRMIESQLFALGSMLAAGMLPPKPEQ